MNNVTSIFVICASACAILAGLIGLSRALFHVAIDLRDNKNATLANTVALKELAVHVDGRIDKIEQWQRDHDRRKP